MNVTYFTGAGASANALPVWSEQARAMLLGESLIYKDHKITSEEIKSSSPNKNPFELGSKEYLLWEMAWFGYKALEFGSIDTFAKKLFLNRDFELLNRLKLAVSVNFTLLEFTKDAHGTYSSLIDERYISLFAKILASSKNGDVHIRPEYSFITWNYDLQLERAFSKFMRYESAKIGNLARINLALAPDLGNRATKKQVIHLNGHHGAFFHDARDQYFIDRDWASKGTFDAFFQEMSFITESLNKRKISFDNTIKYAWENQNSADLKDACNLMENTETLVIIGYSFPDFNKSIDQQLFMRMPNLKKIIVHDKNFNSRFLQDQFGQEVLQKITLLPIEQYWTF